ncbi:MAG TPA: trehalose-6-phosphate synthase [Acidimicrobiales bacterium]|nr:trehalose-6-phosphate synthase [Acidimicrobiales bacterium]
MAVTSRPPVSFSSGGWSRSPGGLAPIVSKALDARGGAWVSWDGGGRGNAPPRRIDGLNFDIYTFSMSRPQADAFYAGYSNRTLWPLFHDGVVPPVFNREWWKPYQDAAKAFTLAATIAGKRLPGRPTYWIQDYHLLLTPRLMREAGVDNPISFFLHTPFPAPSIYRRLPQREEILLGLGGADLVGFHTRGDAERFGGAWAEFGFGAAPRTVVVPASIDFDAFSAQAANPHTRRMAEILRGRLGNRILLFGVERLDYTKGIPERLAALEYLLDRRPDLRRRIVYVQVAPPSRERVPEYQQLRADVERAVGRLNGRFTSPGHDVPFRYIHRAVSQSQLMAYYVAADVALVTPLRDGMNLVAKEYVVSQAAVKGAGALVLSEFAGAADELTDAFLCNPYDVPAAATAIETAIESAEEDRRKRLSVMAVQIQNNDILQWSDQLLRTAERDCSRH